MPYNKKLEQAPYDAGRATPEYPWYGGYSGLNGDRKIIYADPDKPEQSYIERINHDGSFEIVEAGNGEGGLTNRYDEHVRSYSNSHSRAVDGNVADYGDGNKNSSYTYDIGTSAGGTTYRGSGEKEISGTTEGSFHNDDEGTTYKTSKADQVISYDGNYYMNYEKDYVENVQSNKVTMVSGEYGICVTEGNMSVGVVAGKLKLESTGSLTAQTTSTMLLQSTGTMTANSIGAMTLHTVSTMTANAAGAIKIISPSSITLQCGGSKIVMTSGSIKLTSPRIDLN